MPRTRKTGSSENNNGQVKFLKLFTQLLEQKKLVDNNLLKLEKKMLNQLSRRQNQQMGSRKIYVARMQNKDTLALSIRKCMTPIKEMSMKDVLAALQVTGLYKTRSSYVYTMVNNKLNGDSKVVKPQGKRGGFIYDPEGVYGPDEKVSKKKTQKKDQTSVAAA